jgi:hypothetical protein
LPSDVASPHDWQVPLQAESQQTPSVQKPLEHSLVQVQASPLDLLLAPPSGVHFISAAASLGVSTDSDPGPAEPLQPAAADKITTATRNAAAPQNPSDLLFRLTKDVKVRRQ